MQTNTTVLRPSQLKEALKLCIKAGRPAYIESEPGLGKTSIVSQLAHDMDCHLVDPSALTLESVDFRGIPWIEQAVHAGPGTPTHLTRWAMPEFLYQSTNDPRRTILFFDDMAAAQVSVQIAMFQILLEKRSGQHKLRDDVIIIGAGNGASHGAGANRILTPIRTRLVQYNLRADLADWERWAIENGIHYTIPSFLRWRPDLLHQHDNSAQAMPTPRTWEFLSQLLTESLRASKEGANDGESLAPADPEVLMATMEGVVGPGAALEYKAHLKLHLSLPSLDDIIAGKAKKLKLDDPATRYAVVYGLAARADSANYADIIEWMEASLAPEYFIMFIQASQTRDASLKTHPAWCGVKNPDGSTKSVGASYRLAPKLI